MENSLVNINGRILDGNEATISVFDRGFLLGDSVYEVTRSYDHKIFQLSEHLDRLWNSAALLGMNFDFRKEELIAEVERLNKAYKHANTYFRIIVTRGSGEIGLNPELAQDSSFVIIGKEQKDNPSWWYEKGVRFSIVSVIRNDRDALNPNAKSGNYLNNVMAMQEAVKRGSFDAVMLSKTGLVTEGTTSNVWIFSGNKLITPPLKVGILKGLTRENILAICREENIAHMEQDITADEFRNAEEIFISSTTKEIVPVTQVDEKIIGSGSPGKMTMRLMKLYKELVKRELAK